MTSPLSSSRTTKSGETGPEITEALTEPLASSQLDEELDRLAEFPSSSFPVISLYLNTQPNEHGKDHFETFVKKELRARAKTFAEHSPERESFDLDVERIDKFLRGELQASASGVAIFACSGESGFFQAMQLSAPIEEHTLYVGDQPHLYLLARVNDQYPRYAVLLADTNSARLFVFGLRTTEQREEVHNLKTNRTSVGGWSQARYQRHVENFHLKHAKEVIDALDRVVRSERMEHIILSGQETIMPLLRDQMPQHLKEKVVDILKLNVNTPEHEVLSATIQAMRERDAQSDAEKVERLLNEYRAGGLAVVGSDETRAALKIGQVDELILASSPDAIEVTEKLTPGITEQDAQQRLADELVTAAKQTAAKVTFIEDASLLVPAGGVGAMLRYRI